MNFEDVSGEISEVHEKHVIGNWRKVNSCCKEMKNLGKLCASVLWK